MFHEDRKVFDIKKVNLMTNTKTVVGTSCFAEYKKACLPCPNTSCKYWIDKQALNNCVMIAASEGEMTLQDIGDIFGITRMRVCQIEKSVTRKIFQKLSPTSDSLTY